jgi:ABC-2 type transport system ATP-binding protein
VVAILKTEHLARSFGRIQAVKDVSLQVNEGDLYGLLGQNGAGKTTTMRMILRLIRPSAGSAALFGLDVATHFIEVMSHIGALVELPAYYPHLSAAKNLEIIRLLTPGVASSRIPEVLEQIGLGSRMHDAVRTYSQGMRQRLGIAMAILHKPKLVVLDEPTNGLDPAGINHVRELIKELNRKDGVTFIISSHLLHEIEITCNRVGIIKEGRVLVEETVEGLLAKSGTVVRIEAEPRARAREVMAAMPWVTGVTEKSDGALTVQAEPARYAELNAELVKAGIAVRCFAPQRMTLEEYFLTH